MTAHLFTEFPENEQEDVMTLLNDMGLHIREFGIVDDDAYSAGGAVGPIRRQVTVTRHTNGKIKIYEAGHGTSWVADFAGDLVSGEFNR